MSKQNELLPVKSESLSKAEILEKYVYLYDIMKLEIEKKLRENWMNEDFQCQTRLPKEFNTGKCTCFNSRYSCFTGLCINCNKQK